MQRLRHNPSSTSIYYYRSALCLNIALLRELVVHSHQVGVPSGTFLVLKEISFLKIYMFVHITFSIMNTYLFFNFFLLYLRLILVTLTPFLFSIFWPNLLFLFTVDLFLFIFVRPQCSSFLF